MNLFKKLFGWLYYIPLFLFVWVMYALMNTRLPLYMIGSAWKVIRVILLGAVLVGIGFYLGKL